MQKEMEFKSGKNKNTVLEVQELRQSTIKFRCTKSEKEQIKQKAQICNLVVSHYVRQCALGYKPKSIAITRERLELSNYAADLGRLGGLLKLLLTDKTTSKAIGIKKINHLLQRILESQKLLNKAAYEVVLG